MKIVIAPDSYKETLSATNVAKAIESGFRAEFPDAEYLKCPVADGGEGSVEALVDASNGRMVHVPVVGPLAEIVQAFYGISGDGKTAFIEMAAASGIELLTPEQRNPLITTSFGTGQLILHALDAGIRHMIICIGGSATNDGGSGMMQALGMSFKDVAGHELVYGGQALINLASIDRRQLDPRLNDCHIEVACDVTNPLIGDNGASAIYGPQKGADCSMIKELDTALAHYAQIIDEQLNKQVLQLPGSGAAGGMGAAFYAFLNAHLRPGIDIMTEAVGLEALLQGADIVITGEGRLDSQSVNGKVPVGVAQIAQKYRIPVIAIAGALGDDIDDIYPCGINAAFDSVYKLTTFDDIVMNAYSNVQRSARNIAAVIKVGMSL